MAYAILRIAKHSTNGSLGGMTKHNKREIYTPNADPEKTHLNREFVGTGDYVNDVNKFIESKNLHIQKNSVKAIEHMVTASPEWWKTATKEQQEAFFSGTHRFLDKFYGPHSKVVSVSLHRDESTPHAHYFVVPISQSKLKGGKEVLRLGATQFIGTRDKLSQMQDMFAEQHKHLGLERGVKKSKAKHQTIKKLYSNLNRAEEHTKNKEYKTPKIESLPPTFNREKWVDKENEKIEQEIKSYVEGLKSDINNRAFLNASELLALSKVENERKEREQEKARIIDSAKKLIQRERDQKAGYEMKNTDLFKKLTKKEEESEKWLLNYNEAKSDIHNLIKGTITPERLKVLQFEIERSERSEKRRRDNGMSM